LQELEARPPGCLWTTEPNFAERGFQYKWVNIV